GAARAQPVPHAAGRRSGPRARSPASRRGARRAPGAGGAIFRRPGQPVGPGELAPRRRRQGRGGAARRLRRASAAQPFGHRHRHRPRPAAVRAAHRLRPRHRSVARDAERGARQSRPRQPAQLPGAPRRHVPAAAAGRLVRCGDHAQRAALRRRSGRRAGRGGAGAAPGRAARGGRFRAPRARVPAPRARPPPSGLHRCRDARLVRRGRADPRTAGAARRRPSDRGGLGGAARRHGRRGRAFLGADRAERGGMNVNAARAFAERRFAWLGEPLPDVAISFEFFPPKTAEAESRLWQAIERLAPLQPSYVSVTCGAGGNPAEGTATLVDGLRERGLQAAAHLTCATAPRATVDAIAERYWAKGIRHIVALRGDPPKDAASRPNGAHYPFAADLVAALRRIGDFAISVAAYPEPHPEAASPEADFDNLKRKIDAGASRAITQYCFDTDAVLR